MKRLTEEMLEEFLEIKENEPYLCIIIRDADDEYKNNYLHSKNMSLHEVIGHIESIKLQIFTEHLEITSVT